MTTHIRPGMVGRACYYAGTLYDREGTSHSIVLTRKGLVVDGRETRISSLDQQQVSLFHPRATICCETSAIWHAFYGAETMPTAETAGWLLIQHLAHQSALAALERALDCGLQVVQQDLEQGKDLSQLLVMRTHSDAGTGAVPGQSASGDTGVPGGQSGQKRRHYHWLPEMVEQLTTAYHEIRQTSPALRPRAIARAIGSRYGWEPGKVLAKLYELRLPQSQRLKDVGQAESSGSEATGEETEAD